MTQDQTPDFGDVLEMAKKLNTTEERKGRELTDEEEKDWREGQSLYEMDQTSPGWQVIKRWLEDMAYHAWIDPREAKSKEEWEWQEMNAFHAANMAKELLQRISEAVTKSEYLAKVRTGEVQVKGFKI